MVSSPGDAGSGQPSGNGRAAGVQPAPSFQRHAHRVSTRAAARPPREHPHLFRPQGWLDWLFLLGIVGKGLNGLAELIGGALLLVTTPVQLQHLAQRLTATELAQDPHDLIARYLLHSADGLSGAVVTFAAFYLLSHGVVKVVLVVALLMDRLWAYPWMIGLLGVFIGYQLYLMLDGPTPGLIVLTLFDVVIVALTLREWRKQKQLRRPSAPPAPSPVSGQATPDAPRLPVSPESPGAGNTRSGGR